MKTVIDLESVTVCGCSNSIHKGLGDLRGVFGVKVEPDQRRIVVEHTDEVTPEELIGKLQQMGYCERKDARCKSDN